MLLSLVIAAALPPPFPPYYHSRTIRQPADHTNAENHATFQERYLENATWWKGDGSPILFYTGAEGSGVEAIFSHSGYVLDLARSLSALVIFAEMRFFGSSLPFGANESFIADPTHLGLLSVEQTLADYANLIATIRRTHQAPSSPVIALGGSLAGSLAFFLRAKYPSLVSMALASSAPSRLIELGTIAPPSLLPPPQVPNG